MENKPKKSNNAGNWIGVGTATGAAVFAATNDPTWIAVGVAIGAALGWRKTKDKNEGGKHGYLIDIKKHVKSFWCCVCINYANYEARPPRRLGLESRTMGI